MVTRKVGFPPGAVATRGDAVPVEVRLPNMLRPIASGEASVKAEGATVGDVFADLVRRYPGLRPSSLTPEGEMHRHLNVFVNDDDVRYLGKLEATVGETTRSP